MEKEIKQQVPIPTSPNPADNGKGYLVVHVTTAGGAIPLEGARVEIRSNAPEAGTAPETRGYTVASLVSGSDGNTARIPLSAPPRALSERPGAVTPYALYQADVMLEGYYDQSYSGIPIFDGVTSIQPIALIPLPENGTATPRRDEIRYFEGERNDL